MHDPKIHFFHFLSHFYVTIFFKVSEKWEKIIVWSSIVFVSSHIFNFQTVSKFQTLKLYQTFEKLEAVWEFETVSNSRKKLEAESNSWKLPKVSNCLTRLEFEPITKFHSNPEFQIWNIDYGRWKEERYLRLLWLSSSIVAERELDINPCTNEPARKKSPIFIIRRHSSDVISHSFLPRSVLNETAVLPKNGRKRGGRRRRRRIRKAAVGPAASRIGARGGGPVPASRVPRRGRGSRSLFGLFGQDA